ncbi:unnamed protein product, partial [Gongylonema pulchrum]|uniref:IPPc domain-containing protein n=1 Tax=Gongylonema pulchrum TaxID=637853 RepID=A0A183DN60_9BILA
LNFRYASLRTASILIATFNVNGRSPSLDGIPNWLTYEWNVVIARSFPKDADYDLIREIRLVGILLAVYRRVGSKIRLRPAEIDVCMVPTGREGMGNKGGVAISMHMNDTRVCFVNAHFAAHLEKNEQRIRDYRHIANTIRFLKSGRRLFDHDAVFWFGDLNFRLETNGGLNTAQLRLLCADENAFRDMIVYDQLKEVMRLKLAFEYFHEPAVLDFRPTFKYDLNSYDWDSRLVI